MVLEWPHHVGIKVYDITNRASFLNTSKWIEDRRHDLFRIKTASLEMQDVRSERGNDVVIILVGNKTGPRLTKHSEYCCKLDVEGLTWQTDGKSPQKRARKRPRHKAPWAKLGCIEPSGWRRMASCSSRQVQRQAPYAVNSRNRQSSKPKQTSFGTQTLSNPDVSTRCRTRGLRKIVPHLARGC